MKSISLLISLLLLVCANAAFGQSVYKCTNEDGSVSYQDRACPGAAKEKKVVVGSPARKSRESYEGKVIQVPGVGEAAVLVFDYMETIVRENGDRSTTIGIRSKSRARDKMSMMMTFMQNPSGDIPSRQDMESTVKRIATEQTGMGTFGLDFRFQDFQAKSGTGIFSVLHDPRFPDGTAPDKQYATITVGQIVDKNVAVAVTILSDGVSNKGFTDALAIAETFVVAPGVVAVNHEGGDLQMPQAPGGFSWQQLPEIKGAVLRPDGWNFDTQHKGNDFAYFVSREPNVAPDGFDTGLTINVETNVPARTGMQPSQYAAEFIRAGSSELDTLGEAFTSSRGPFVSHGALFHAKDDEKGDFNAHMVAIANDATGTVYLCIFEGPAANWQETWRVGEVILQKLVIDDSI